MNHPTDPMTPVRALIEAAGKATPGPWESPSKPYQHEGEGLTFDEDWNIYPPLGELGPVAVASSGEDCELIIAARNATASISQLLSEHDKVVEYIKELRDEGVWMPGNTYKTLPDERRGLLRCADRLQSIVEGK